MNIPSPSPSRYNARASEPRWQREWDARGIFVTRNDTLPLRLMQHMLSYADPSIAAMSTMLLVASLGLLLFLLPFATGRHPQR